MEPTYQDFIDACRTGDLETVRRALALPEVLQNVNNEALVVSANGGYLAIVNRLLEIPEVLENAATYYNHALKSAAFRGHLAVVNRLLEITAVRGNVTLHGNQLLRHVFDGIQSNCTPSRIDVATRLLQEKDIIDYLNKYQQDFIEENKEFFKEIEDRRVARILAAQSLSQTCDSEYITSHILALAYHNVLCGKSVCTKLAQNPEEGLITCPVINQFQNHALGAKARAQVKLGTQATTSSSATSSAEPAKKARIN